MTTKAWIKALQTGGPEPGEGSSDAERKTACAGSQAHGMMLGLPWRRKSGRWRAVLCLSSVPFDAFGSFQVEPPPRPGRQRFGVQVMFSDHQPAPGSTARDAVDAKDKVRTGDGGVREQEHQAERLRTALDDINRPQQDEPDLTEPSPSAPPFASIWAIRETAEHRELELGHEPPPPPSPPVAHHPDDAENHNRVLQVLDEVLTPSENLYGPRDEDDGYDEVGTSDDADPADFPVRGPRHEEFADEDEEEDEEALRCCGCGGANARRDRDPDVDCDKQEQQTGALKRRRAVRDSGGGCCGWVQDADGVGPMARPRKSRDVLCMALFVLCWLVWVVLVWTMVTDGCPDKCNDPRRLIYGADSVSNELCGFGSQVALSGLMCGLVRCNAVFSPSVQIVTTRLSYFCWLRRRTGVSFSSRTRRIQ